MSFKYIKLYTRKKFMQSIEKLFPSNSPNLAIFSNDLIGREIIVNGFYEYDQLILISNFLDKKNIHGGVFMDIGANIGNHTVFFKNRFKKILSFEPNPLVYPLLTINTKESTNINLFPYGLSNKSSKETLYYCSNNIGKGGVDVTDTDSSVPIDLKTFDNDLLEGQTLKLIKIDTEGHEELILKGMQDILIKQSPYIIIEVNIDKGDNPAISQLKKMDYIHFWEVKSEISGAKNRLGQIIISLLKGYNPELSYTRTPSEGYHSMLIASKST